MTASESARQRPRRLLWLTVGLIVLTEVLALYVVLPGRASPTFTAVQPDSMQYLCYGLHLSGHSDETIAMTATDVLTRFGYPGNDCLAPEQSTNLVWQVYPRLLLPTLIALASWIPSSSAVLMPSVVIFGILAWGWVTLVIPTNRSVGWRQWPLAILPLLAFNMILWPAAVLTEGPITVLSIAAVTVLASATGARRGRSLALLAGIGVLMLLTRQTWPMVGTLWAASILATHALPEMKAGKLGTVIRLAVASGLGFAVAWSLAKAIEIVTVPIGLKESQPFVPEGIPTSTVDLIGATGGAIQSTWLDILSSVARGDIMSPVLLVAGIAAIGYLARRRAWSALAFCSASWLMGVYAVGLVAYRYDAYGTHFRYLVPAVFATTGAALIARRTPQTAKSSRVQSAYAGPWG